MFDFTSALAGLDGAIRAHILGDIDVSPTGAIYRTVRGAVSLRAEQQTFDGFESRFAGGGDTVEIDALDFVGAQVPTMGWLVRYRDDLGVLHVKELAGPLTPTDVGGRFLSAPLTDLDPDDDRRP